MKKLFLAVLLLAVMVIDSSGQWYYKKYGVSDINALNKEQMDESLRESGYGILASGVIAGFGGLLIWAGKSTLKKGLDDDATFIEELLGAKFMGHTYIVLGYGCIAGGAVAAITYFSRHEKIRSVIHRNFGPDASLSISPSVIMTGFTQSSALGMTVNVKF